MLAYDTIPRRQRESVFSSATAAGDDADHVLDHDGGVGVGGGGSHPLRLLGFSPYILPITDIAVVGKSVNCALLKESPLNAIKAGL